MATNILIVIIVTSLATYLSRFLGVVSAEKIKETSNLIAALTVSKNAYIQELKSEIIKSKTGFVTD